MRSGLRYRTQYAHLIVFAVGCSGQTAGPTAPSVIVGQFATVRSNALDSTDARAVVRYADEVAPRIERELGGTFGRAFAIELFATRDSLTAFWRTTWQQPSLVPECWMIGSATADMIALLAPRIWSTAACGQDPANATYVRRIVAHEATHVLHRRLNGAGAPASVRTDELSWFAEGLAVAVSGQLDAAARDRVRNMQLSGRLPARTADLLQSGYDAAGSLVAFIRGRWPAQQSALLRATTQRELLSVLGIDETTLMREWASTMPP